MRRLHLLLLIMAGALQVYAQHSRLAQSDYGPMRTGVPNATIQAPERMAHIAEILNSSVPIDSFFARFMASYRIPGMAACIIKNKSIAWKGNYGVANLARNIPVSDSTIFFLASISKTVTATALMQLYEAGRFGLDDSVDRYLPFPVKNPNHPKVPITFRMLLTHTSSIQDNWNIMPTLNGDPSMAIGTFLREYLDTGRAVL